ncbi:ABC transporter substrate-binding protein [Actinacidiphila guanduensis]|uniref:Sulfonate transport system substrate-binding protein n=1 Tax=Actinacidiphila guanduensis TaxID=310781 RepID=A0A1H0LJP5_9ACTN|nr:ABC transporter substrate-binding protein [Actinacidiphila guanduensis]SDO68419.1 sulfonate transport system substrate-binding protein [Actinacidiphila guanduensis]
MPRTLPRLAAALSAALALGLVLAGCGSSTKSAGTADRADPAAAPAASGGPDLSGVTLTLGDQANGLQTLLDAAGTLKGAPYKVKWAEFQGAAPLFQAMQSGQVDTGTAADLPTLQAISGGLKIKLVAAATSDGSGTAVITRPGSPVHSVADLKGRTVVVSSAKGSIAEYLLAKALTDAGLTYSDVHVQYLLPTAAQAAFNAGKIQTWATFGIYQDIAMQKGARIVVNGRDGRTSGVGFLSAAQSSLADPARKAAVADFLDRLARAYQWAAAHPAQFASVFAKKNGVPADVAATVVSQGARALQPVTPALVTKVQAVSDLMHSIGSLPTDVQVAGTVDTSAFPHAPGGAAPGTTSSAAATSGASASPSSSAQ